MVRGTGAAGVVVIATAVLRLYALEIILEKGEGEVFKICLAAESFEAAEAIAVLVGAMQP